MVSEGTPTSKPLEFHPFSRSPWEHALQPDPALTLELRRFEPPGGAFVYKAYPAPVVEDDGVIHWLLPSGEYAMLGSTRVGVSGLAAGGTQDLARFTVPPGGGTVYLGTLWLVLPQEVFEVSEWTERSWLNYEVRAYRITDEADEALPKLKARFPSLPTPLRTNLMHPPEGKAAGRPTPATPRR